MSEDEGIFGRKAKGGQNAIAKAVKQDNAALALQHKQAGKLAVAVATGATVTADAQRVLLFLASYGDGPNMGKAIFSSGELVGLPAAKKVIGQGNAGSGKVTGSGSFHDGVYTEGPKVADDFAVVPASPPTEDGEALGFVGAGSRLNDAVMLLVGRGWAKITEDGEFGIDTSFHEVGLTEQGRAAAQGAVKKAGLKAGASFEAFEGLPGLFDDAAGTFGGTNAAEREQLTAMLSRAKVGYSTDHLEHEGTTVVAIKGGKRRVEFTFDVDGALLSVGGVIESSEPDEPEVTQPNKRGARDDTSGG